MSDVIAGLAELPLLVSGSQKEVFQQVRQLQEQARKIIASRASVAAVEGDAHNRAVQIVDAWIVDRHLWPPGRYATQQDFRILKEWIARELSNRAAASSPLPAEVPPCERCADDANYEPAGLDEYTNLWLHRGRTGEGYVCRLKHPNGLAAPAEPAQPHVADAIADGAIGCRNCGDTWERPVSTDGVVAACEDCGDEAYSLTAPAHPEGEQEK